MLAPGPQVEPGGRPAEGVVDGVVEVEAARGRAAAGAHAAPFAELDLAAEPGAGEPAPGVLGPVIRWRVGAAAGEDLDPADASEDVAQHRVPGTQGLGVEVVRGPQGAGHRREQHVGG